MVNLPVDLNFGGMMAQMMYWLGYGLLMLLVVGGFGLIMYVMQFNIKAEVFPLFGSGKDGVFSFSKSKYNRVKWIKKKTAWKPMLPPFNKKEIEPFDQEYIYPGNKIKVFDYNGEWFPGRVNINTDGHTLKTEINPVPYYVRNWQSLKHKQHAQEFAEHNWWADNKYFFMVLITAGLCLIMVGLTVYFTYEFATGGTNAANNLADALRGFKGVSG